MRNRVLVLGGLFAGLLLGTGGSYPLLAEQNKETPVAEDAAYENIRTFTRALQIIRQDYVDGNKVSYRDLTYGALRGMLSSLDPHSAFMAPQGFQEMQDDTKSQFGGLGIEVTVKEEVLTVVSPMEGTPAAKAGVLPGDQIIKIDGESTEKMSSQDAVGKLRGKPGEKVTLTIARPSTKEIRDFTIERAVIKVESVREARLIDPDQTGPFKIGYVRIVQFSEPTAEELAAKLDKLEADGMEALVLDLRNNPGGLLNSAVEVCAQFLPPKTLVVSTDGRTDSSQRSFRTAADAKQRKRFPIAVLVNHNSASASEIVAGALKDLNRAIIVGETTFGKGSVQTVLGLPDGSAMRLTTAKYYTPSKQVIHEHGVAPNIRANLSPEAERAIFIRRNVESLSGEERKELARYRDTQLDRAIDALKGVMIFTKKDGDQPPATQTANKKG